MLDSKSLAGSPDRNAARVQTDTLEHEIEESTL